MRPGILERDTELSVLAEAVRVAAGRHGSVARRGQPGAGSLLLSAWKLAVQIDELQRTGPAAAACAEDAWLGGDRARARDIAAPVYQEAKRLGGRVYQAELGYWLAKAGSRSSRRGITRTRCRRRAGGGRPPRRGRPQDARTSTLRP